MEEVPGSIPGQALSFARFSLLVRAVRAGSDAFWHLGRVTTGDD